MTLPDPISRTLVGHWKLDRCQVYVGRGSIWGNPYATAAVAARSKFKVIVVADPITAFEAYLRESPQLLAKLPEIRGRILGCYCRRLTDPFSFPSAERCHGEILARYADRRLSLVPALEEPKQAEQDPALGPGPLVPRHERAPYHQIFDGEPTMTFAEWWRR